MVQQPEDALRTTARVRFEVGRSQWPQIRLAFDAFESYFASHATAGAVPAEAHAADMYLACAASLSVDAALAAVDGMLRNDVARAVAAIDSAPSFVEETLQLARARLLVAKPGERCKLAAYAGRASLRTWLRAVVVNLAITRRRAKGEQRHLSFSEADDHRLAMGGPELEYLRNRYRGAFEDAVRAAIERLATRERLLLRLNVVNGMSIDQIGLTYRVGRSTAARWLARARCTLFDETRRELCAKLRLTSSELESLTDDIRSQIEVSLSSILAGAEPERADR
jgi:RNA polymerase sigma-70 factor (ECF subfamily)